MKFVKTILKLLVIVLLVAWTLNRPVKVHAQNECWTCESGPLGSCMQSAQQWMVGCVNGCPHQGSPQQACYNTLWCGNVCDPEDPTQCEYVCNAGAICENYPSSGVTCVQSCINEMDNLVNGCTSSYCDPPYPC
jgi:hypothetical protein